MLRVGLFETEDKREFKSANEMDDTLIKVIQHEYFKRTFVNSFIAIFIGIALVGLYIFDLIPQPRPMPLSEVISTGVSLSDIILTVIMFLVAFCGGMTAYYAGRCIFALTIVSKIKKKKFLWYTGFIQGKEWRYPARFSKAHLYYSIDDKYFAQLFVNPKYKKETPVYFLYFPGLSDTSSIGGAVIRYYKQALENIPEYDHLKKGE